MKNIADTWNQFKADQPELALALSVLPVTGQVSAAVEYYDAMRRGDTAGAVVAAAQFLPGAKILKEGVKGMKASQRLARQGYTHTAQREAAHGLQSATTGTAVEGASLGLNLADYSNQPN